MRELKLLPSDANYDEMDSPVGILTLIASSKGLHAILWEHEKYTLAKQTLPQSQDNPTLLETKNQLRQYFQGKRQQFDLPLVIHGTDFQMQCWQTLQEIPYGKTISYKEQANRVGNQNKARAVGAANGKNPLSIVIPCHRVIGSGGALVGFGGGLDKKNYLLQLENASPT